MAEYEKHILPNGTEVLYNDEEHKYFVNGKEIPSVTTILKRYYGDAYSMVNQELLKSSSNYGTAVHVELDRIIQGRKADPDYVIDSLYQEVLDFFTFVEPIYKVKPLDGEKVVVVYDTAGEPFACGRFDLICEVKGELTLADFKTTSTIHRQLVTGQLNLYALGAYQSGYITLEQYNNLKLGAIHLNKSNHKFVPITKLADGFCQNFMF